MSPELQKFYNEIQEWIDNGCPEHPVFKVTSGLCFNEAVWSAHNRLETCDLVSRHLQSKELTDAFPFNGDGQPLYFDEVDSRTIYQNPARLAWIREHATIGKDKARREPMTPLEQSIPHCGAIMKDKTS